MHDDLRDDRITDARNDRREQLRSDYEPTVGAGVRAAINEGMAVGPAPIPPAPRINLMDIDGEPFRRFTNDGPFEVILNADVVYELEVGIVTPAWIVFKFPNADVARDHLKPIGHAVAILNDVFARAHAARTAPIPDAATCRHHVRIERFSRRLAMQATCDRCLTVLAPDVAKWLTEHGYGDDLIGKNVPDNERETVAGLIEQAANRAR